MWEDGKAGGRRAIAKKIKISLLQILILKGKDSVNFKLRVDSMDRANSTDSANLLILSLNFIDTTNKNIFQYFQ